jgi:hypothetical protein
MTVPRRGVLLKILLSVYVLAAALLPLSHHDVICHLKSATHCTTCLTASSAETTSHVAALDAAPLTDAGRASSGTTVYVSSAPANPSSGRSPPSLG